MNNEFNSMDGEVTSYEIPTALAPQTRNYIDQAAIQNETINATGEEKKQSSVEKKLFGADEKHFFSTMIVIAALTFIGYNVAKKQGWLN